MRKKDNGWRTEWTVHNDFIQQHTYTHTHTKHMTHKQQTTKTKNTQQKTDKELVELVNRQSKRGY